MAKKSTAKKGSKKTAAKKTASKKVAPKKEETPVAQEPIVEDLTVTDTEEETVAEPQVVIIKDIGKPIQVDDWRVRVKEEAAELKIKMDALRSAVDGRKVPATEVEILNKQHAVMREYYIILNTRLSR